MTSARRLVVIPPDPVSAYEKAGYDWLERYYNPKQYFDEVFALSPREPHNRDAHGMKIRRVAKRRLRRAIREISPAVVRAYGGYVPADLAEAGRVAGIPTIVSVHDARPEYVYPSVRLADVVLCMSHAVRKTVLQRGTRADKIRILPNRVDLELFRPITHSPQLSQFAQELPAGKRILHLGRKHHEKNLDTVIRALQSLPLEYVAIFVGAGIPDEYQRLAEELGVANRCCWRESIPNRNLPDLFAVCDCMCVPSRWEGFGMVFIEAAACGIPIVTSNIAPMSEYLRDEESALLISEYENPVALALGIRRAVEDSDVNQRLRSGARLAAKPFDLNRVDDLEVSYYQATIDGTLGYAPSSLAATAWRLRDAAIESIKAPVRLTRSLVHASRTRDVAGK